MDNQKIEKLDDERRKLEAGKQLDLFIFGPMMRAKKYLAKAEATNLPELRLNYKWVADGLLDETQQRLAECKRRLVV